jgi:predicted Rossmann fold nucleotide-binding protein DprA/Smf involved in DNA uptake
MDNCFEEQIINESRKSPRTTAELLERFKSEIETSMPSLINLEKKGKIKKVDGKYVLKI